MAGEKPGGREAEGEGRPETGPETRGVGGLLRRPADLFHCRLRPTCRANTLQSNHDLQRIRIDANEARERMATPNKLTTNGIRSKT